MVAALYLEQEEPISENGSLCFLHLDEEDRVNHLDGCARRS